VATNVNDSKLVGKIQAQLKREFNSSFQDEREKSKYFLF